jgi:hypothetical protein
VRVALLDALIVFAIIWIALSVAWLVRQRRRPAESARWGERARSPDSGGHVVELVCPGQPPQEVKRIPGDLDWDRLGTELAEGMSEAEARAATLNGARAAAVPPSAPRRRPR